LEQPLSGLTIIITRAAGDGATRFADALRAMGAEVIDFATIEIASLDDYSAVDSAIGRLDSFDWVIFTSVNGVDAFMKRLELSGRKPYELSRARLGVIGPATAARLEGYGLAVDAVPGEYRAEAIIDAIGEAAIRGARFLIPRAAVARDVLPRLLAEKGAAEATVVSAYRTVVAPGRVPESFRNRLEGADLITFTSSSTVNNFCVRVGKLQPGMKAAVIGPITAETARSRGFEIVAMPTDYTIVGLVGAIRDWALSARK
jgi:uroporphyrinogen III methyltransferase/synthase